MGRPESCGESPQAWSFIRGSGHGVWGFSEHHGQRSRPLQRGERYITVGLSSLGRLLMVAHAEHGDPIRIISARILTRREKRAYENEED
jgi:uncharacterized DUF497 family protein